MYAISAVLIACYALLFVIVVVRRKHKVIQNAQPLLLWLMPLGGILTCVTPFVNAGEPSRFTCVAPITFASVGFTLTFGSLLLRTYRIYRVFDNPSLKQLRLKTSAMLLRLSVLLGVDFALLLAYALSVDPRRVVVPEEVDGVGLVDMVECSYDPTWPTIFLTWKGLVMLTLCGYAYKTRNVRSDFSEAKLIFFVAHEVLLCGLVVIPLMLSVAVDNAVLRYVLSSVGIFVVTLTSVFILVGSKVYFMLLGGAASATVHAAHAHTANTAGGTAAFPTIDRKMPNVMGDTEVGTLLDELEAMKAERDALLERVAKHEGEQQASDLCMHVRASRYSQGAGRSRGASVPHGARPAATTTTSTTATITESEEEQELSGRRNNCAGAGRPIGTQARHEAKFGGATAAAPAAEEAPAPPPGGGE